MSFELSGQPFEHIIDEFVAHLAWFQQAFKDRFARPEVETYEEFKQGLIEEARRKNIRIDVIDILFKEMERRNPSVLQKSPLNEDLPNPESSPNPKPVDIPNPADTSKKERRGKKKKNPKSKKKFGNRKGRLKGQGNLTPNDFPNAIRLQVLLGDGFGPGCPCPLCQSNNLESTRNSQLVRFTANEAISAQVLVVQRVRCKSCSQEFEAPLPHQMQRDVVVQKATPQAAALSIVLRYGMGFPNKRLEDLAFYQGVTFSHSRQWQITKQVFEGLLPLYDAFEQFVANAEVREVDDCQARIVSESLKISHELWIAQELGLKETDVRTGVQFTVWVATQDGISIRWFKVGRPHQGEREFEDSLEPSKTQVANCWEHLRQTFENAAPGFKKEMVAWMDDLHMVFERDAQTKQMSSSERLSYHQKETKPIVERMELRARIELSKNKKAEPSGAYAKAIQYFLNHLPGLTLFLKAEKVPLTTSYAELGAKFTKRHHKNSLSFQTQNGGNAGAFMMSLIATCMAQKINPLDYLTAVIEWRQSINSDNVSNWMPHTFKTGLAEAQKDYAESDPVLYRMCPKKHKKKEHPKDSEENGFIAKSPPPAKSSQLENQTLTH